MANAPYLWDRGGGQCRDASQGQNVSRSTTGGPSTPPATVAMDGVVTSTTVVPYDGCVAGTWDCTSISEKLPAILTILYSVA